MVENYTHISRLGVLFKRQFGWTKPASSCVEIENQLADNLLRRSEHIGGIDFTELTIKHSSDVQIFINILRYDH